MSWQKTWKVGIRIEVYTAFNTGRGGRNKGDYSTCNIRIWSKSGVRYVWFSHNKCKYVIICNICNYAYYSLIAVISSLVIFTEIQISNTQNTVEHYILVRLYYDIRPKARKKITIPSLFCYLDKRKLDKVFENTRDNKFCNRTQ